MVVYVVNTHVRLETIKAYNVVVNWHSYNLKDKLQSCNAYIELV